MTKPADQHSERRLTDAAIRLRREHERTLDELTVARLRAIRLNATATPGGRNPLRRIAAGAVAAALVLALAGVIWLKIPSELPARPTSEPSVADLDLLETESPDFYNNLEFYTWLASQPDAS